MATRRRPQFDVVANLVTDEFERDLDRFADRYQASIVTLNQGSELLAKGLGIAGAAVGALADFGEDVARALGDATVGAVKFHSALAEVQTIADSTVFSTEAITKQARELASIYGSDVIANVGAEYQTLSAGITDAVDASALLREAGKLAVGGLTDQTTAVDGLTTAVNAYRSANLTAQEASDAFFIAIRDGKTTAGELAGSLGNVASIASQLGVEFDDLLAATAAITTGGVSTSEAMTQVRAILVAVAKQSQQSTKVAKELGIEFSTAALKAKGLQQFLEDVVANSGATDTQLARLFGRVEALGGALSLTANGGEKFNQILGDMDNKAGAADAAFRRMDDTLAQQIKRFEAIQQSGEIAIGSLVADSGLLVGSLKSTNDVLAQSVALLDDPEMKKAADELFAGMLVVVADLLVEAPKAFAAASTAFDAMLSGVTAGLEVINNIFAGIPKAVINGIGPAIEVLEELYTGFEEFFSIDAAQRAQRQVGLPFKQATADGLDPDSGPIAAALKRLGVGIYDVLEDASADGVEKGLKRAWEVGQEEISKNAGDLLPRDPSQFKPESILDILEKPDDRARKAFDELDKKKKPKPKRGRRRERLGPHESDIETERLARLQQLEEERLAQEAVLDARRDLYERQQQIEDDAEVARQARLDADAAHVETLRDLQADEQAVLEARNQAYAKHADMIAGSVMSLVGSLGDMAGGLIRAGVLGEKAGTQIRNVVGGFVQNIGQMLLQMGLAAIAMSALSVIPVFAGLVGPPGMSAGAGAVAAAAGAVMIGVGAAIQGGGSKASTADNSSARPAPSRMQSAGGVDRDFEASRSGSMAPVVNHYNFHMPPSVLVAQSETDMGMKLHGMIRRAEALRGAE